MKSTSHKNETKLPSIREVYFIKQKVASLVIPHDYDWEKKISLDVKRDVGTYYFRLMCEGVSISIHEDGNIYISKSGGNPQHWLHQDLAQTVEYIQEFLSEKTQSDY